MGVTNVPANVVHTGATEIKVALETARKLLDTFAATAMGAEGQAVGAADQLEGQAESLVDQLDAQLEKALGAATNLVTHATANPTTTS